MIKCLIEVIKGSNYNKRHAELDKKTINSISFKSRF